MTQLKIWDAAVDALAAKGEKVSADARKAYYARIKDLRSSRAVAQKTFQEILVASESARAQLQASMEATWEAMQKALGKMSLETSPNKRRCGAASVAGSRTLAAIGLIAELCSELLTARSMCSHRIFHGALPHKGTGKSALYSFGSRPLSGRLVTTYRLPEARRDRGVQA